MKSVFPIFVLLGAIVLCSCDRMASLESDEVQYASLAPRVQSRAGTSVSASDSVLITVVAGTKVIDTTYPYAAHRGVINHVPVGAIYALTVRGFNRVDTSTASAGDTTKRVYVWSGADTGTAQKVTDSATAAANAPTVTVDTATPIALGLTGTTLRLASAGTVTIAFSGTDSTRVLRYAIDMPPTAASSLLPVDGKIAVTRTCRLIVRTFQKLSGTWVGATVPETLAVRVTPPAPVLLAVADSATASVRSSWGAVGGTAKYLVYGASDSALDLVLKTHLRKLITGTKDTVTGLARGQCYTVGIRTIWGPDSLLRDTSALSRAVVAIPQDSTVTVAFASPLQDTVVPYGTSTLPVRVKVVSALSVDSVVSNGTALKRDTAASFWSGTVGLAVGADTLRAVAYAVHGKSGVGTRCVVRTAPVLSGKPVIERVSPTRDSTMLYTGQTSYNVQVRVLDSNAVSQVTIGAFPAVYDVTAKTWSTKVTLLNGWNTFAVEALDAVGNLGLDTVRIFVDQVKPVLKLISPSYDTTIYDTLRTTFRVEVQATDSMGVASVTIGGVPAVKLAGTDHWVATTPATNDTVRISVKDSSGNDTDRVLGIWHHYFIDSRDGQKYNYVKIGTQTWMAQNLNYRQTTGAASQDTVGRCYEDSNSYCAKYGRLYAGGEFMSNDTSSTELPSGVQGICPSGWHIPSNREWSVLVNYIDSATSGIRLRSLEWYGSDQYGFKAMPSGTLNAEYRSFYSYCAAFWTSSRAHWGFSGKEYTQNDGNDYYQNIPYFSLRCVKNE